MNRNHIAKTLWTPKFRPKVVSNKKLASKAGYTKHKKRIG